MVMRWPLLARSRSTRRKWSDLAVLRAKMRTSARLDRYSPEVSTRSPAGIVGEADPTTPVVQPLHAGLLPALVHVGEDAAVCPLFLG
jgi:hypothetical protein